MTTDTTRRLDIDMQSGVSERKIRVVDDLAYVPLTKGYEAVIDAKFVPVVRGLSWYAKVDRTNVYALAFMGGVHVYMHRLIISAPEGMQVDHIDCDGLNNRFENLRLATRSENQRNKALQANNTSGYKGVCWHKHDRKWRASIRVSGKNKFLGNFDTAEEAHRAYCAAANRLHKDFARTA